MNKLSDLITNIKTEIQRVPVQNAAALTILGFEIKEKAQSMIGTHQVFWKDLADSTIATKRRKHWGKGGDASSPLWATGAYHDSIQYQLKGRNKVQIFSDEPYVEYLEWGTAKMPARPVFLPATKLVLRDFLGKGKLQGFYLKSLR